MRCRHHESPFLHIYTMFACRQPPLIDFFPRFTTIIFIYHYSFGVDFFISVFRLFDASHDTNYFGLRFSFRISSSLFDHRLLRISHFVRQTEKKTTRNFPLSVFRPSFNYIFPSFVRRSFGIMTDDFAVWTEASHIVYRGLSDSVSPTNNALHKWSSWSSCKRQLN